MATASQTRYIERLARREQLTREQLAAVSEWLGPSETIEALKEGKGRSTLNGILDFAFAGDTRALEIWKRTRPWSDVPFDHTGLPDIDEVVAFQPNDGPQLLPEDKFTNTPEDAAEYEAERDRREQEAWRESERKQERA